MATFLLIIIYISFISLGLPDSLLGSAWPVIYPELSVPVSFAGIISMIVSGGTIISSLLSDRLIRKFGTGKVTIVSVFMTAAALLGFFAAPHYAWLCVLAIPLGLGAGAVDSGLNNFVALHYKASHMNWLHCFWGIGATTGPVIMSLFLGEKGGWRNGYLTISIIQFILVGLLFISLPCWKASGQPESEESSSSGGGFRKMLKVPGAKSALISFFCYCAVEATTGLWGSTYLVNAHKISADTAAKWISTFYFGITVGRLLSGFLTSKLNNRALIRLGQIICLIGTILILLPLKITFFLQAGFIFIGLGCAPIYPAMLHETPNRFGKNLSQSIMGIQMAFAYIGATFIPPLFGFISGFIGLTIFPIFILLFIILMIISSEYINKLY